MKKIVRIVSLTLVLAVLLSVCVFAAPSTVPVVYGVKMNSGFTAKLDCEKDAVVNSSGLIDGKSRDAYKNVAKIDITFAGEAGKQYMVFLLNGDAAAETIKPTEGNEIYYINQITATGSDAVTIYPKNLKDAGHYRIYISSVDGGYVEVGELNVANSWEEYQYLLGDVDGDGDVDAVDALEALKAYARLVELDANAQKRADVDSTSEITVLDAMSILKKYARLTVSIEEG